MLDRNHPSDGSRITVVTPTHAYLAVVENVASYSPSGRFSGWPLVHSVSGTMKGGLSRSD